MKYILFILALPALNAHFSYNELTHSQSDHQLVIEHYAAQFDSEDSIYSEELQIAKEALANFLAANEALMTNQDLRIGVDRPKKWQCPYCNNWWELGEKCTEADCPTNRWNK